MRRPAKQNVVKVFIFSLTLFLLFHPHIYGDVSSGTGPAAASLSPDEQQILKDRDDAIQSAIGQVNQENGKKKLVGKKVDLKNGSQKDNGTAEAKTSSRLLDWKALFFRRKSSDVDNEVREKRHARLEKFSSLDPGYVRESITKESIEAKRQFVAVDQHSLENVIGRAIQTHLPAQIARERVELADRRIWKAFRDFFTEVDLQKTYKDGTLSSGPYKSRSWRASFRQPLFRGGVLWNTYRLEQANRETALKEYRKAVFDVVAEASKSYFEYERAWNVLKDRQALFEKAQHVKKLSDEKYKANFISEIDRLNADSLFSQAQYDVETAEQDLELAKLELQRYLGLDIEDPIKVESLYEIDNIQVLDLSGKPITIAADEMTKEDKGGSYEVAEITAADDAAEINKFIDLAYTNRSDLQIETSKLRAARLSHRIASGKLLPEAELIMEFGQLGEAFVTGPDSRFVGDLGTSKPTYKNEWRIGTELSWNISGNTAKYTFDHDQRAPSVSQFLGGQGPISDTLSFSVSILDNLNSLAELRETKIATLEQVVELEKTERDVIREVKEAYFNYNKALIQVESNYKRMGYRDRLAELAKHRLETNEVQISEYLQSEIDYTEERAQVHRALADFYIAKANLNRAIGIRDYLKIESHQFERR